ncbi:MAG: STAS domain-containing protein [Planctomycetota bacterium]
MSLHATPVVLPYRLEDSPHPPLYNFQIDAVASSPKRAVSTAVATLRGAAMLHHRAAPLQIYKDRASVGEQRGSIEGPYAYLFTHSNRVPMLTFAPRIEGSACDEFADSMATLHPGLCHGILLDMAPLSYITTRGLSILVEHSKRLNMHCFRLPPNVLKVIDLTGLHQHLHVHDSIHDAIDGMIQAHRHRSARPASQARL